MEEFILYAGKSKPDFILKNLGLPRLHAIGGSAKEDHSHAATVRGLHNVAGSGVHANASDRMPQLVCGSRS